MSAMHPALIVLLFTLPALAVATLGGYTLP